MSELKIGDRVRTISVPTASKLDKSRITIGMKGTVKEVKETKAGVEFDSFMGGHKGNWNGINGHCWYLESECLEKIKIETMEQKILETLRKEIGVEVGEEFDVYENGEKRWTCKFEENGHLVSYKRGGFEETFIWKYWVFHFDKYVFKKKQFIPKQYYSYHYVRMSYTENDELIFDGIDYAHWEDSAMDIAMLSVGNVFATEREAAANKEKVLGTVKKCIQNVIG